MSDEKRQTRLLPFRLRRRPARDAECDFPLDAELRELLRAWEAPAVSTAARERLLADFRASARRAPLWRRALRAELRVPLPLAACAVAALLSLLAFAAHTASRPARPEAAVETQTANAGVAAPAVKVVEVPVVRERVVTRFVYVEKKGRRDACGAGARPAAQLAAAVGRGPKGAGAATGAGGASSYFTRVDMEDFRPADEMKIRIVRKGKADEK
jgi:hypothetical protein